eukprot:2896852-Rhodomonas_salina.2
MFCDHAESHLPGLLSLMTRSLNNSASEYTVPGYQNLRHRGVDSSVRETGGTDGVQAMFEVF